MRNIVGLAAAILLGCSGNAFCAEFEVKLLDKGATGVFVFEPALLKIAVGDTVTFKAVDMNHTVGSVRGMVPANAQPFKGDRSKDLKVTFTVAGLYGYECFVHIHSFGMSGLIVVGGDTSNLPEAKAAAALAPPREREKLEALLAAAVK